MSLCHCVFCLRCMSTNRWHLKGSRLNIRPCLMLERSCAMMDVRNGELVFLTFFGTPSWRQALVIARELWIMHAPSADHSCRRRGGRGPSHAKPGGAPSRGARWPTGDSEGMLREVTVLQAQELLKKKSAAASHEEEKARKKSSKTERREREGICSAVARP